MLTNAYAVTLKYSVIFSHRPLYAYTVSPECSIQCSHLPPNAYSLTPEYVQSALQCSAVQCSAQPPSSPLTQTVYIVRASWQPRQTKMSDLST